MPKLKKKVTAKKVEAKVSDKYFSVKLNFKDSQVTGSATLKVPAININEAFYVARSLLLTKWPDIVITGGESKLLKRAPA